MEENQSLTPIEAINEYYRLKDKYESGYYDKYVKPIIKSDKSNREKRIEFSKLPKHECINCKRNVGSIFSLVQDTNELLRKYIVKCGDLADPCPLDIQINYSSREPFDSIISTGLSDIDLVKLEIIKEKNNALFFNNNANIVSIFERLTDKLKFETENTGSTIETNILKNHNQAKIELLNKTVDDFGKGFILPFKQMIQEYMEKSDELVLNQAVTFYVNEMVPKLKEIQNLKYEVNFVEYNENTGEYFLIQQQNSLQNKEFSFESDDKVVKFIRGEYKSKKSKNKNVSLNSEAQEVPLTIRTKPRKLNTKIELIEATEALNEEPSEPLIMPIKFQVTELKETPIIEGEEVMWENPKYMQTWNKLPTKLKNLLVSDPEWLEDFMNKCMNNRNSGKPCKIFLPKQTEIPPKLLENGQYDFGSEIVNKLFNKQNETHKKLLLTLYTEEDDTTKPMVNGLRPKKINGPKNYNLLKNALEDLLEKEFGTTFNNGYI
jgi:hypothetical protein